MGILNVTPDSFSDGGAHLDPAAALDRALAMEAEGADAIDVGAESTRPGSAGVGEGEEWSRLAPVIGSIAKRLRIPVSVDTRKASVAERSLEAGAEIVNDVSMLRFDSGMANVVGKHRAGLILMHSRQEPATMQVAPGYRDLWGEVLAELSAACGAAEEAGVDPSRLLVDPGIGFSKTADHNLSILAGLSRLEALGKPAVVGPSRKSFLGAVLDGAGPTEREFGTAAAVAACAWAGVAFVRVHSVLPMVQVCRTIAAIRSAGAFPLARSQGP